MYRSHPLGSDPDDEIQIPGLSALTGDVPPVDLEGDARPQLWHDVPLAGTPRARDLGQTARDNETGVTE